MRVYFCFGCKHTEVLWKIYKMMTSSLMAYTDCHGIGDGGGGAARRHKNNNMPSVSVSQDEKKSPDVICSDSEAVAAPPVCDIEAYMTEEEKWDCVSSDDLYGEEDVFWPPPPEVNVPKSSEALDLEGSRSYCTTSVSPSDVAESCPQRRLDGVSNRCCDTQTASSGSDTSGSEHPRSGYQLPQLIFSSRHSRAVNWNLGNIMASFRRRSSKSENDARATSETPSPPKNTTKHSFVIESEADNNADVIDIIDSKFERGIITEEERRHLLKVIQGHEAEMRSKPKQSQHGDNSFEEVPLDASLVQSDAEQNQTVDTTPTVWARLKRLSGMFSAPQYEQTGTMPPTQLPAVAINPDRQHPSGSIVI
eukprot:m.218275 g.218275  ORF g.218275 m.218275 type:complete len:364 (-) comp19147_c0_seq5:594-1685(-)